MTEIEKIEKYIKQTKISDKCNYCMRVAEWTAIADKGSRIDAVGLAFNFGRAKGYRAAMKENGGK